ncbi:hypothetical protein B0H10DRAFT_2223129 [Mycena sp. CBHHK59/15]|nr:hypothetical protein B0H10DRAFT_2223129 [Mycena sp. CBHHK59/15]
MRTLHHEDAPPNPHGNAQREGKTQRQVPTNPPLPASSFFQLPPTAHVLRE